MSAETPQSYARKVCGYIANDNDVAKHVKRMWGIDMTVQDVARIRRDIPGQFVKRASVNEPLPLTAPVTTSRDGFDPLAAALHRYHAKNAPTQALREHWGKLCK